MDLLELMQTRHSIRKFKQDQIPQKALEKIIAAGRCAPSGHNQQVNHFVVVQNPTILKKIQKAIISIFASMDTPAPEDPFYTPIARSKANAYPCMYHAPTFILIANKRGAGNGMADSTIAMMQMMLMAHDLGLGSCRINQVRWLQDHPQMVAFLEKELGIPAEEAVYGCLSIGYPDQPTTPPTQIRGNKVDYLV